MGWHLTGATSRAGTTITVPFPWESRLSGQGRTDYKGAGWYEREITIPEAWRGCEPILHFGAVDWEARVWVNGQLVAENKNGFLPFSCNLSGIVSAGDTARLTVRAHDIADASTLVGKQVPRWYTHSSGIWQTVWLEGRTPDAIEKIRITPDIDAGRAIADVTLSVRTAGRFELRLTSPQRLFDPVAVTRSYRAGIQRENLRIALPTARLWSPDSPFLYALEATLVPAAGGQADAVSTHFGMRSISRARYGDNPHEYILLNHEPIYLRGALDQAFHPDGLYTYPTDDVIRGDMELAKACGLNMLRCHIKINDPSYYFWADRLGLIIHYDMPSPGLDTPGMRAVCARTVEGMIDRDFNHPSIMLWVLFNETWGLSNHSTREGQEWLRAMVHRARALDPTRLVEDNSPCHYDHVETDVNSWHFYINDYHRARGHIQDVVNRTHPGSDFNYVGEDNVQAREPLMNSEYGGISAAMGDMDIAWCFKYLTTELRRHAPICGYVYTELTDIEWEHNGFVKYDRSRKLFGYDAFVEGMTVADLNSAQFAGLDCPPCQTLVPGGTFAAQAFVSQWGPPLEEATIEWEARLVDRLGTRHSLAQGALAVKPERFGVVEAQSPLEFDLGPEAGLVTVALRLVDEAGNCLHRNYVNLEIADGTSPRLESDARGTLVRFAPGTYRRSSWATPVQDRTGTKVAGSEPGALEYRIDIPPNVNVETLTRLEFLCEIGARAHETEKLSWPPRNWRRHTPQTMERKFPSQVDVHLAGVKVATWELEDDPADARGVLSHHYGYEPGSYGYLRRVSLTGGELAVLALDRDTRQIVLRLDAASADSPRGFALYGERAGSTPVEPTILFT